jgi:hypothetical protein
MTYASVSDLPPLVGQAGNADTAGKAAPVDVYTEQAKTMLPTLSVNDLAELLRYQEALETQIKLPEAAASVSGYFTVEGGGEFLMTVRALDADTAYSAFSNFGSTHPGVALKTRAELPTNRGAVSAQPAVATTAVTGATNLPVVTSTAPTSNATGNTGDVIVARAEQLSATIKDGKKLWGVKLEGWKFDVRIWPEVLAAAGMAESQLDPLKQYNLGATADRPGWIATCTKNERGYPGKVIKLVNG